MCVRVADVDGCDVINMSLGGPGVSLVDVYSLAIMQTAGRDVCKTSLCSNFIAYKANLYSPCPPGKLSGLPST
jgi:hypothetical protein